MYRISQLARKFGLSRSTLLYYDRIGLLPPSGRSGAGYRIYSSADCERLDAICSYRRAGLSIEDTGALLARKGDDGTREILQKRLRVLGDEIRAMQARQQLLARMLKITAAGGPRADVDRDTWVEMMRAAGMDDEAMHRWHGEFERRAPDAHRRFLGSLGMNDREVLLVRTWAAG